MADQIMRVWTGRILTSDRGAYTRVVEETGMKDQTRIGGHLGSWITMRDLDEGYTEVATLSIWESREAIEAFAGYDIDRAVFYDEEQRYLIDKATFAAHYDIVAGPPVEP